jgi:MerR family transcriptional regulator/heat shock protein HspR
MVMYRTMNGKRVDQFLRVHQHWAWKTDFLERANMDKKEFWTVTEVMEIFEVDERFLSELEEEDLLSPVCREGSPAKVFRTEELEKLKLVKDLVEDMGVNLPGVEVILRMRQMMFDMRRQFDEILDDLAQEFQDRLKRGD